MRMSAQTHTPLTALTLMVTALLGACSDGSDDHRQGAQPFDELVSQGVTRYLGMYSPSLSTQDGDVTSYQFAGTDGPRCLNGSTFNMATRDTGSEDLHIFLQGGGACWSSFCSATNTAPPGIPAVAVLDPGNADNPLADYSTVYVPYCDGGLHASDADIDTDGDGISDRYHRGLHNLSASLDVAVSRFPAPRRIVLTGVSGGGYGTIFALPLVRQLYPGVPIDVVNDSGIGITRPDDPAFNQETLAYWNIASFFPASCAECTVQGGPTEYLDWQLQQDPDLRLGMLSYTRDSTIADFFLGIGGATFEALLRDTLTALEARNPQRMHSFIRAGNAHTFLLGDLDISVEGVGVGDWVGRFIQQQNDWDSVSD